MSPPNHSPQPRISSSPGRTPAGLVPGWALKGALAAILTAGLAAPSHAARSGQRPKINITVHDTGTPPIGKR